MRHTTTTLFVVLLILSLAALVLAQDPKPVEQKPAAAESEKPKSEVDEMISESEKRGDKVLAMCIDASVCGPEGNVKIGNVEKGHAVHLATPAYSPLARAAHIRGSVDVQVIIDEDGKVIAAAAVSGHPLLQSAAVKAARESLFTTTKFEGAPVKVTGVIRYNFIAQ